MNLPNDVARCDGIQIGDRVRLTKDIAHAWYKGEIFFVENIYEDAIAVSRTRYGNGKFSILHDEYEKFTPEFIGGKCPERITEE